MMIEIRDQQGFGYTLNTETGEKTNILERRKDVEDYIAESNTVKPPAIEPQRQAVEEDVNVILARFASWITYSFFIFLLLLLFMRITWSEQVGASLILGHFSAQINAIHNILKQFVKQIFPK